VLHPRQSDLGWRGVERSPDISGTRGIPTTAAHLLVLHGLVGDVRRAVVVAALPGVVAAAAAGLRHAGALLHRRPQHPARQVLHECGDGDEGAPLGAKALVEFLGARVRGRGRGRGVRVCVQAHKAAGCIAAQRRAPWSAHPARDTHPLTSMTLELYDAPPLQV
jgi:hypothetical protein